MKLREALKKGKKLTKKEMMYLKAAYDIVGSIAIIEIPRELVKKQKVIANTLLWLHKQVHTVVKKKGIHAGELRLQKVVVLAGEKTKETIHVESGTRLKVNVEEVYFSARLSTERLRVAKQIKKGERVLVMFSGCAPYPCVFSRNTKAKHIFGIELNKKGHELGLENVRLNKAKNITLFQGDVRKVIPKLMKTEKKFDRVLMPLPRDASQFLDLALNVVKKKGKIHLYDFVAKEDFPQASKEKIKVACKKARKKCRILRAVQCGSYAPGRFRVCVDFTVL